jgi:uncharacterized protein (DUF58 family)
MKLTNVTKIIHRLRQCRCWESWPINQHTRFSGINTPLLSQQEILDLRYRVEEDRENPAHELEVEHRTLGETRSVYRGYGIDYDESRPYFPGDELRFMNWRATARTGEPHMKVFREERRPAVFIVVDRRQNMRFGTKCRLKVSQAVRAAAITAFSSRLRNAPVAGVLLQSIQKVDDKNMQEANMTWIAETNDEAGVFNFIHAANAACPPPQIEHNLTQTTLSDVIKLLTPMLAQGSNVVLISDFHDLDNHCRASLLELSMTHRLQAIHIIDPVEKTLPACGNLLLQSNEDLLIAINSTDKNVQAKYQRAAASYLASKKELFRSLGIACHSLMTDDDSTEVMVEV